LNAIVLSIMNNHKRSKPVFLQLLLPTDKYSTETRFDIQILSIILVDSEKDKKYWIFQNDYLSLQSKIKTEIKHIK